MSSRGNVFSVWGEGGKCLKTVTNIKTNVAAVVVVVCVFQAFTIIFYDQTHS